MDGVRSQRCFTFPPCRASIALSKSVRQVRYVLYLPYVSNFLEHGENASPVLYILGHHSMEASTQLARLSFLHRSKSTELFLVGLGTPILR